MTESENNSKELSQPDSTEQKEISLDNIMNFVTKLSSNQKQDSIDLTSIMGMANTLLKNEKVLSSLQGLGNHNKLDNFPASKDSPKQEDLELRLVREQIESLVTEINALKLEIMETNKILQYIGEIISGEKS